MDTKEILDILPDRISRIVLKLKNIKNIQEIRVKCDKQLCFNIEGKEIFSSYIATREDIKTIIQRMSYYSMYSFDEEIKQGYITINGGHRVGICGRCVVDSGTVKTIKNISSINIRICRQVVDCSKRIISNIIKDNNILNTIVISPPNCGKTTIIRDLTRLISNGVDKLSLKGNKVCIVDERSEIAACYNGVPQLDVGKRTDVLDSCPKSEGILMAIRSMSPEVIVCDEIGTKEDIKSIVSALNSGVKLISTIHGFGIEDIYKRPVFKDIIENHVFKRAVVLSQKRGVGTVEYVYDFDKKTKI